jgi:hypothetical protein
MQQQQQVVVVVGRRSVRALLLLPQRVSMWRWRGVALLVGWKGLSSSLASCQLRLSRASGCSGVWERCKSICLVPVCFDL